jgi:SpoIIAA-like
MPIEFSEEGAGTILVIHVTGTLVKQDYSRFIPEFERHLGEHGKPRVLFDMRGLHGWDAGAMWEDLKFDVKHFSDIDRLAMIGDKKWQHGMAIVFKPFTGATARYFDSAESTEARKWLAES